MAITLEQAKELKHGQILHDNVHKNADGTCQRWRVNGRVKRWKRMPDRIEVPIKYGLKTGDYLTNSSLGLVHMEGDFNCPQEKARRMKEHGCDGECDKCNITCVVWQGKPDAK